MQKVQQKTAIISRQKFPFSQRNILHLKIVPINSPSFPLPPSPSQYTFRRLSHFP